MLQEPLSLEEDLTKLEGMLYSIAEQYPDKIRVATSAEVAYEIAFAEAQDSVIHEAVQAEKKEPPEWKTSMEATLRTQELYRAYREAKKDMEALNKQAAVLANILGSTQSRVKLELAERGASGMTS